MGKKQIRVVIIADLHAGHRAGLTHPDFDRIPAQNNGPHYAAYLARRRLWEYYITTVESLRPIDVLICNGDAIDGKGERSGGTELLTSDRNEQTAMAAEAIAVCRAREIYMAYGTGYHTGYRDDWEDQVARMVNAVKIGGHDYLDVRGLVLSYRHYVGRSSIPHGRGTPLAREWLWNVLWSECGEYPRADVLIRSHVHTFHYCGGFGWLGIITPALQGYGSKYGARLCSGTVDFGLIHIDIIGRGDYTWRYHIMKLRRAEGEVVRALTSRSGRRSTT